MKQSIAKYMEKDMRAKYKDHCLNKYKSDVDPEVSRINENSNGEEKEIRLWVDDHESWKHGSKSQEDSTKKGQVRFSDKVDVALDQTKWSHL